jgi:hypothetical protein
MATVIARVTRTRKQPDFGRIRKFDERRRDVMTRFNILTGALAIGGLIALTQSAYAQAGASTAPAAQQQTHEEHHPAGDQPPVTQAQEKGMMEMRQKMMADMKAMDATLEALVTKMKAAKGDAKVDAIAELVAAVVQQRTAMHDRMTQMQSQMMGHMMQHMSAGMSPEMKKMMAACPMMKQMEAAR